MLKFLFFSFTVLFSTACFSQTTPEANTSQAVDNDDIVFTKTEKEAQFPGGIPGWIKYIRENLNANVPVKKKAPAGTYKVMVRFIVSKTGKISNIVALTDNGYGMEKEVIRIIKKSPDWEPAMQNDFLVNAYRQQPVTFVVTED